MNDIILEMRDITKTFPGVKALENVNLKVRRGDIHAICGENGAGKSTLMKILMGVHRPDEGQVLLDGADITDQSVHDKLGRGITMIFQELSLLPNLTVAENILLGREPRKPGWRIDFRGLRREAQRFLDTYDFPIRASDRVEMLGFAQRQMVEIVKALASGARVLIMDEPTAALDEQSTGRVEALVRGCCASGMAVLVATHDSQQAHRLAGRRLTMAGGRVELTDGSEL